MKILSKIVTALALTLTILIYWVGSLALHLYTIYIVYKSYGLFWGIISFFSPIISQIIVFVLCCIFYGISNLYCILVLIYIATFILTMALSYLSSYLEKKLNNK